MNSEEKKAFLLLKSVIFHYHGLDNREKENLEKTAKENDAINELKWVYDFMAEDYSTAFDRARIYFAKVIGKFEPEKKLSYLDLLWKSNSEKGYVTEMEATAIIKLAKDWDLENELMNIVRN